MKCHNIHRKQKNEYEDLAKVQYQEQKKSLKKAEKEKA
jgi:hypothetical protein